MSLDILRRSFIVVFYAGRAASVKRIRAVRSRLIGYRAEIRPPSRSRTAVTLAPRRSSQLREKHGYASFTAFFTTATTWPREMTSIPCTRIFYDKPRVTHLRDDPATRPEFPDIRI